MKNRPLPSRPSPAAPSAKQSSSRFLLPLVCASLGLLSGWWFAKGTAPKTSLVSATSNERIFQLKPGPWGDLECIRISIEVPAGLLKPENYIGPTRWFFKGHSREGVMKFFKEVGLSPDELRAISQDNRWQVEAEGCNVFPGADFVTALQPEARRAIYTLLGRFTENKAHYTDFLLSKDHMKEVTEESGLSPEIVALFQKLVYPEGDLLVFNDIALVLSALPDRENQLQFLKVITRRSTFLMKLKIDSESDMDALVTYWGGGKRAKDIRPLLESLQRVPGGCTIDVSHLVPFFARKRIYTYPTQGTTTGKSENCHWTALNFFTDPPNNEFLNPDLVEQELRRNYVKVKGNPQLGDLILLREGNGGVVHSATYIAEDVLFTKNGEGIYQPWLFMKATDVIALYSSLHGRVSATLYRQKEMESY